jgi:hypothetical protein
VTDRTRELIVRQAQAMGAEIFEIGLFKPTPPGVDHWVEMLLRTWDLKTIEESIPWLKFQNVDGRNIYIRPKGEHALTLVDDLTSEALERMKHSGFTPAAIVETSPENFQAWLNHGRVLTKETSTPVARALAEKFGGDPGSADWRHFGRLVAFSNRKEKHRQPGGHYPFVRLVHATGEIYENATTFVQEIEDRLKAERTEILRRQERFRNRGQSLQIVAVKTIDDFRKDPKYASDGNRIDLAYAVYALSHGVSEDDVRTAICSRDLKKKGTPDRQRDYLERTIQKAHEAITKSELAR